MDFYIENQLFVLQVRLIHRYELYQSMNVCMFCTEPDAQYNFVYTCNTKAWPSKQIHIKFLKSMGMYIMYIVYSDITGNRKIYIDFHNKCTFKIFKYNLKFKEQNVFEASLKRRLL